MHEEMASWEPHKNATYCLEQILEVVAYKKVAYLAINRTSNKDEHDMLGNADK